MRPDEIIRLYDDAYAAKYEREFLLDPLVRSDTEAELQLLRQFLSDGGSWLDVACGTGFFLRHFPHIERAGIDLSPAMLRLARQGNPEIALRQHDFREPIAEWEDRWGWFPACGTPTASATRSPTSAAWSRTCGRGRPPRGPVSCRSRIRG
jgi:SAM-dependent methyltransferase